MFYEKLTRTTIPKILSVSLLTTNEHPGKVKKNLQGSFFIIYEKLKNRLQFNSFLPYENEKIYHRFYTDVNPHFEQHYC